MEPTETTQTTHTEEEQTQRGAVSSPAIGPKDEEQNIYTEKETHLAEKYKVEPKLIRMIAEIVSEQIETQGQEKQTEKLCIDQQTQERLKSYYRSLEPKVKLAITAISEIQALEGINFQLRQKEGRLLDEIWADLESTCLQTFHRESDDVADIAVGTFDSEDVWLCGIWEGCRMVSQNT